MPVDIIEKINSMPDDLKIVFKSDEPRLAMERACFLYEIFEDDVSKIARPLRDIFIKEIPLAKLPIVIESNLHSDSRVSHGIAFEIADKIFSKFDRYFSDSQSLMTLWKTLKCPPLVSEEKAHKRVLEVEPWILEDEKEQRETAKEEERRSPVVKNVKILLREAIQNYPALGEQAITLNPLSLKSFNGPVRPSINNWIKDYQETAGVKRHEVIERGNYLFHSENGKKLTPIERQKVTILLRALDENLQIDVDVENKKMIFNIQSESSIELPTNNLHNANFKATVQKPSVETVPNNLPAKSLVTPSSFPSPASAKGNLILSKETSVLGDDHGSIFNVQQNNHPIDTAFEKRHQFENNGLDSHESETANNEGSLNNFAPKQSSQFGKIFDKQNELKSELSGLPEDQSEPKKSFFKIPDLSSLLKKDDNLNNKQPASGLNVNDGSFIKNDIGKIFEKNIGFGTEDYFTAAKKDDFGVEQKKDVAPDAIVSAIRFEAPQQMPVEKTMNDRNSVSAQHLNLSKIETANLQSESSTNNVQAPQAGSSLAVNNSNISSSPFLSDSQPQKIQNEIKRPAPVFRTPFRITPMGDKFNGVDSQSNDNANPFAGNESEQYSIELKGIL